MRRITLLLLLLALIAAACSSDEPAATTAVTTTPPAPATTVAPTTTLPPEPPAPWWEGRVFYEVFVRSFQDSDGDGIGDLRGLIDRLDYLNDGDPTTTDDLGVTGIWLMPIMSSPSYHGYDVTDYRKVNFQYGTNEDFLELMDAAQERGIAVIVDLVLNHTSRQHKWFARSFLEQDGYDDWYVWDDREPGAGWHAAGDRTYFGLFWEGMPDLNLENPDVTAELYDIADFWLNEMGVDGFRLDAVKHFIEDEPQIENTPATLAWAQAFNEFTEEAKTGALTVGEVWNDSRIVSTYIPDALDLAFEFTLASEIIDAAQSGRSDTLPIVMQTVLDEYPLGQYSPFLTNHDQDRVASVLVGDASKGKLAASLLLTIPGVPFMYYGEEIGMRGRKPDELIRTPMPWDATETGGFTTVEPWQPFDPNKDEVNVAAQIDDPDSLLSHYRSLIQLRSASSALRIGEMTLVDTGNNSVFAFTRESADQRLLVVINLNKQPQSEYGLPEITAIGEQLYGADWTLGAELPGRSTTIVELGGS